VVARLVGFCGVELSSFYLDVIKDRLYCDTPDSRSRRAAQTVLHRVADSLLRLLSPILSFTADESWRFLGRKEAASLADLPVLDTALMDQKLSQEWKVLLALRELVLAEIEKARAAGRIKAPREAWAKVRVSDPQQAALYRQYEKQLPMILGVSRADLSEDSGAGEVTVEILKSESVKCARCWVYKSDVGVRSAWPDICPRCAEAVEEWQKNNPTLAAEASS
jgi:isoleucyl-tRNA synthetase